MTNDSAFISEIWGLIKLHIANDSRAEVCEGLVSIFDSYNCADGFEDDVGFDKPIANAIREYYGFDDEGYDDE